MKTKDKPLEKAGLHGENSPGVSMSAQAPREISTGSKKINELTATCPVKCTVTKKRPVRFRLRGKSHRAPDERTERARSSGKGSGEFPRKPIQKKTRIATHPDAAMAIAVAPAMRNRT